MRRFTAPFSVTALTAGALVAGVILAADLKSALPEIHANLTRSPAPTLTDLLPVEIERTGQTAAVDPFPAVKVVSRLP